MRVIPEQKLSMKVLTAKRDMDMAYRLRYQVFNEELGWVAESRTRMEIDEYDENCILLGIFYDERLIGCLRIISSNQRFMIEKEFCFLMGKHHICKTEDTIEVTRFCIAQDIRKYKVSTKYGTYPIIMVLEKAFYNWCRMNDVDNVYMVVSKQFFRLLNLLGMPCTPIAEEQIMPDGVVAMAALSSWSAFEEYNYTRGKTILDWFKDCHEFDEQVIAA